MPKTIIWFRFYAACLALSYLFLAGVGVIFLTHPPADLEMSPTEGAFLGSIFIAMGLLFFIAVLPAFFLPRRGWAWIYGLVLIVFGLTSLLYIPLSLPILIFWLRDPVKNWFVPIVS
ncbi:MAG: hypothetical protein P1U68_10940 [Verrucomicrobiales bacterium]|nr:hypothetical protein [Verrucomicrobiales bacterium]